MVLLLTNVHNDVLHLLSLPDAWNKLVWHDTRVLYNKVICRSRQLDRLGTKA